MKLSDRLGTLDTEITHLHTFVSTWYRDNDRIAIVGIPNNGSRKVLSLATTKEDLLSMTSEDMINMCFFKEEHKRMSMYMGINPLIEDHEVKISSRGKKKDIERIIGLFVDLDVKPGAFSTKKQIYNFLDNIPLKPTIVVDNGSMGGVHAYWKVKEEDQKPGLINEDTLKGWWAYLNENCTASIDKLTDSTRISRMPSSIYWPKEDAGSTDIVRVKVVNDVEYSIDEIDKLSRGYAEQYEKKINHLRRQKMQFAPESLDLTNPVDVERLERLIAKGGGSMSGKEFVFKRNLVEYKINNDTDWSDILEPFGWTYLKTQDDGSRVYARPGKTDRSAVVDYVSDDGTISPVMSLLSLSEQTNLLDLKEANVPLTKYQVLLRLKYNDNEVGMVEHLTGRVL